MTLKTPSQSTRWQMFCVACIRCHMD